MHKYLILLVLMMCMFIGVLPARSENRLPAVCITTSNLNVREYASTNSRKLETLPSGTKVKVLRMTNDGWAVIDYNGSTAYCYAKYFAPVKSTALHCSLLTSYPSPPVPGFWRGRACAF